MRKKEQGKHKIKKKILCPHPLCGGGGKKKVEVEVNTDGKKEKRGR